MYNLSHNFGKQCTNILLIALQSNLNYLWVKLSTSTNYHVNKYGAI